MKLPLRTRPDTGAPGLVGVVRADRRTSPLLARVRPGDLALIDHADLDRATAVALVDAGVAAVLNASPMLSGRFPSLGPQVLIEAGIPVVDGLGREGFTALRDGQTVRLLDGLVYDRDLLLATGRVVDAETVDAELEDARSGMTTQLETFVANSGALLRREQDLFLHGLGLPTLRTRLQGRPVVVAAAGPDLAAELKALRPFLREQRPVVIGVGTAAEVVREVAAAPEVVVLAPGPADPDGPSAKALKAARDVVACVERGASRTTLDHLERRGVRPLRLETGTSPEDAALVLADVAGASLIVAAGMGAGLEELLDRRRPGLASTYLTRLRVGHRLVPATAVRSCTPAPCGPVTSPPCCSPAWPPWARRSR
ncbi:putative cytokinetic ring protein SteA [Nocardioides sp.]|uniref:putative cytokinetic ring protein SteA n=1 Tax=Nocardioides sp. TaxID=35761 RepID=UPI003529107C